jgi:hypothetical protein
MHNCVLYILFILEKLGSNSLCSLVLRLGRQGYLSFFRIEGLRWIRFRKPSVNFCCEKSGVRGITVLVREVISTSFRKH